MDDINIEKRQHQNSTGSTNKNGSTNEAGRQLMMEVDRLQSEISKIAHISEASNQTMDSLKMKVVSIETAIGEKKKQLEKLVNEMKEVNLQSLAVVVSAQPSDEIRHLLEGCYGIINNFQN